MNCRLSVATLVVGFVTSLTIADEIAADRLSLVGQPSGFLVTVGPGPERDLLLVFGDKDYGTDLAAWPQTNILGRIAASSANATYKVPFPSGWRTDAVKKLRVATFVKTGPTEYTPLEFVQSSVSGYYSGQQVDTGIYPNALTGITIEFEIIPHTGYNDGMNGALSRLYGAADDWFVAYRGQVANYSSGVVFAYPYSTSSCTGIQPPTGKTIWSQDRYEIVQNTTGVRISDKTTGESDFYTTFNFSAGVAPVATAPTVSRTLWLFGMNAWTQSGGAQGALGQVMGTPAKLFSCTIVTGVTQAVARDFVPAKKNGKAGLYDKVTGQIFYDRYGQSLTAGPEVQQLIETVDWSVAIDGDKLGISGTSGIQADFVNLAGTQPVAPDAAHIRTTRQHEGIPSFAIDKTSGRMWATWYGSPSTLNYGENADNYTILATSDNEGTTWSEIAVADPDGLGGRRAFDPEVWVDDECLLHWSWTDAVEQQTDTMNLMEVTFPASSVPKTFPVAKCIGHGVMMCKPTKLENGNVLYPVANWHAAPSANFYMRNDEDVLELVGGITIPQNDRGFDEHIMIQRADGSLYSLVRGLGNSSALYESVSTDGGVTWTVATASSLGHPSARLFMRQLASGNILLVKHGDIGETTSRTKLKAFLSQDGGLTWNGGLLIDDGSQGEISYPDGDQGTDGVIHVVYDQDRMGKRNILLASFTEEDVLAGEDVSGKVSLRQDVHRGATFTGNEPRRLAVAGVASDFSVEVGPGDSRGLYMVYGTRDCGTEDFARWPHCLKLASIEASDSSVTYAFALPEGWGEKNTKFRLFVVPELVELEFVNSTAEKTADGTFSAQWIDTGIFPDGKTGIEIDFQVDQHAGYKNGAGAYSRLYGAVDDWSIRYVLTVGTSTERVIAWPYSSSASVGFLVPASDMAIWNPNRYRTIQDMTGFSVSNLTTGAFAKYGDFSGWGAKDSPANGTKVTARALWIYGANAAVGGTMGTVAKIYSCTIVTGETQAVARDFVPAKQGDKVGLYDRVTKTLFCSGSGTALEAGPEKSEAITPVGWSNLCESLPIRKGTMIFLQ